MTDRAEIGCLKKQILCCIPCIGTDVPDHVQTEDVFSDGLPF